MAKKKEKKNNPALISYLTLRKTVGILGVSFPIVLVVGSVIAGNCQEIQSSVSAYYHTNVHDLFVGILCAIALFLFTYKGYNNLDSIAGNLAGLFALGVAFFPTSIKSSLTLCIPNPIDNHVISAIHYASAAGLFLSLAYFSIILFTKSDGKPTKMKIKRNRLYRICGYIILASIVLIAAFSICRTQFSCQWLMQYKPTFWLETIALWAFGLSWLTKGRTILIDAKD